MFHQVLQTGFKGAVVENANEINLTFSPLSTFLSLTPSRGSYYLMHSIMHYACIGKTLILLIRARTAVNYSDCKFNALFTRASYYVHLYFTLESNILIYWSRSHHEYVRQIRRTWCINCSVFIIFVLISLLLNLIVIRICGSSDSR